MSSKLSNWLETILKVVEVVGVVSAIGVFIKQLYQGIDSTELILILITLFCIIIASVIIFLQWRERRRYENLPYILEKRDNLVMEYIDRFEINLDDDNWVNLLKDYSQLMGFRIDNLLKVLPTKDENLIIKEFENTTKNFNNKTVPQKKTDETLVMLLDMGGILNSYNAGLESITSKPDLQKLDKRIKSLQRKVPAVKISQAVNDYYQWSEGLYLIILATKSLYSYNLFKKSIPTKIKAKQSQVRPTIERQITNLISAVRESIVITKEKNKGEAVKA
jgi:hypothetical protein